MNTILIVDDIPANLAILKGILEATEDYIVTTTQNPGEALDLMDDSVYDLVITDFNMPGMNGFDLFREAPNGTPFILMSANLEIEAEALERGFIDFIAKPFHPRLVIAKINARIKS